MHCIAFIGIALIVSVGSGGRESYIVPHKNILDGASDYRAKEKSEVRSDVLRLLHNTYTSYSDEE